MDVVSADHDGGIQMIDNTSIRAYQRPTTMKPRPDNCLGRSRDGLTTKIHVVVEGAASKALSDVAQVARRPDQLHPRRPPCPLTSSPTPS
jgi:hypothetical protein